MSPSDTPSSHPPLSAESYNLPTVKVPMPAESGDWESEFTELEYRFLQLRRSLAQRMLEGGTAGDSALRSRLQDALREVKRLKRELELDAARRSELEQALAESQRVQNDMTRELNVARGLLGDAISHAPSSGRVRTVRVDIRSEKEARTTDSSADTVRPPSVARRQKPA